MMKLNKTSNLSVRLAIALKDNQLTATDLAKKIGMSKQAISTYLTGVRSPKLPVLRLISETLNVNDMWLMGFDTQKERKPTATNDGELICDIFSRLNEENRKKILEIARLYIANQKDK